MPNNAPAVGTVEQGYRFKGGDPGQSSSWQKVTSESEAVAARPTKTAPQPSLGGKFAQHPPNIQRRDEAIAPLAQRVARSKEYEKLGERTGAAGAGAAMAAAPMIPGAAGAVAGIAGRGLTGMEGARYGGKLSSDVGIGSWPGRVVGGVAGAMAPEVLGKFSNPIIRGIAGMMGKGGAAATEGAAGAAGGAETTSLMTPESLQARTLAERVARGAELSPEEEATFNAHVQKTYTPESGIEPAAQKAGRIYAGRGTSFRPTNEQLSLADQVVAGKVKVAGARPSRVMQGGGSFVGPTQTAAATPAWQAGQGTELTLKAHSVASDPNATPEEINWARSILKGERPQ